MLWIFIFVIFALHIALLRYVKTILSYINNHNINPKRLPFYFGLILFIQISGVSLINTNIKPINLYDKSDLTTTLFILLIATIGLMLFGYLGKKHPFMVKLSAVSAISVLYLHYLILSSTLTNLFDLLFGN